ncbi:MAG: DoxX family protein [Patescibacteria group bacterium]
MIKQFLNEHRDVAILISRFIIGGIFIYAGWMKVSDMAQTIGFFSTLHIPTFLTYIVSYGEVLCGALLVLGLFSEIAKIFLAVVMIFAIYFTYKMGFQVYSTPLAMLGAILALLGSGAGKYSIKF